jgi:hypothetical protein
MTTPRPKRESACNFPGYANCSGIVSSCPTPSILATTKRKCAHAANASASCAFAAWRATATSTGSSAMAASTCSRALGTPSTLNMPPHRAPQRSALQVRRARWSASCSDGRRGRHERSNWTRTRRIRRICGHDARIAQSPVDPAEGRIFHHWPLRVHTAAAQPPRAPRPHRQHRDPRPATILLSRPSRRPFSLFTVEPRA